MGARAAVGLPTAFVRRSNGSWSDDALARITVVLAQGSAFAVGLDVPIARGVLLTTAIAVVLAPLWVPAVRTYRLASSMLIVGGVATVAGFVLAAASSVDHKVDTNAQIVLTGLLVSGLASIALLLWARTILPLHQVVLLYGVGSLVNALMYGTMSWKFDLVVPTTFVVLGLLERFRSRLPAALAVLGLGLSAVLDQGRSVFGFALIAFSLTLWQLRPAKGASGLGRWSPALLMVGLCVGIYFMATTLLVDGVFGEELQVRSQAQIESTGNLLVGGRPEFAATRELVKLRPAGFGAGVVPSWSDLEAGRSGLTSINVDTGGYVNNYMFGKGFALHSVAADLWVSWGVPGFVLAVLLLIGLIRSLSFRVAARAAPTSIIFAATLALWYLCFGPIFSNWIDVCAAVGLALIVRGGIDPVPTGAR